MAAFGKRREQNEAHVVSWLKLIDFVLQRLGAPIKQFSTEDDSYGSEVVEEVFCYAADDVRIAFESCACRCSLAKFLNHLECQFPTLPRPRLRFSTWLYPIFAKDTAKVFHVVSSQQPHSDPLSRKVTWSSCSKL